MKFSVIITTFNRPKHLQKAYASVLLQSQTPNEVIIINNGKNFYKKNFFPQQKKIKLKIINSKKNLFPSKARNKGAKISKNNFLAFLDDDDVWQKNYLLEAKKIILRKKGKIILSKIYKKKSNSETLFKDPTNINLTELFVKNLGVTGSNIVINKKLFFSLGGYKSELEPSEDKSLVIEALLKKTKIFISKSKVFFSTHEELRLTTNYFKLRCGTKNFYKKYKKLMSFSQKIKVLKKLNIFRIKSGQIHFVLNFFFFFLLTKIIN